MNRGNVVMLQALAHTASVLIDTLRVCPTHEEEEATCEVDRATHAYALLLDFESRQESPKGYSELFHLLNESSIDSIVSKIEKMHGSPIAERIRRTLDEHGFDAQAFSLACDRMDFSPIPVAPIKATT